MLGVRTCEVPDLECYIAFPYFAEVERDSGYDVFAPLRTTRFEVSFECEHGRAATNLAVPYDVH